MKKSTLLIIVILCSIISYAQQKTMISGPMLGHVELRSAKIWFELPNEIKEYKVILFSQKDPRYKNGQTFNKEVPTNLHFSSTPVVHEFNQLEVNTHYQYTIILNNKGIEEKHIGTFKTTDLWASRQSIPDFTFLAGSCYFVNDPKYDRARDPHLNDMSIFKTMEKENADFMLWLGDNWYYREVDYGSVSGLYYRASKHRSQPMLQNFLKAMPHYAVWDDHDFGKDNDHTSYIFKAEARKVFMKYWANPSYGSEQKGIYTAFAYNDVDFFLLDDRYFRDTDLLKDSLGGKPNPNKKMFGDKQLHWLFNQLAASSASFKIIVTGSQMLNENSPHDCLIKYPTEYDKLLRFLQVQEINGVVFLTGDLHCSEVIKKDIANFYPLYDITSSPLTADTYYFGSDREKNNPNRVVDAVHVQNYSRIRVSGKPTERTLSLSYIDGKGKVLATWSVNEQELKVKK